MPETTPLPEDVAAAERIYVALSRYVSDVRGGYDDPKRPDIAAIIAASRTPLVARLVEREAQLVAALKKHKHTDTCMRYAISGNAYCIAECRDSRDAALSPAPVLDLGKIERALLGTGSPSHDGHCWCAQPNFLDLNRKHEERCLAARAALASLREVTK